MSWKISKEFDFCYGHRVWSQSLNTEFSLDGCLMCRHLHGHQGKIIVYLESDSLTNGMVTDFKHLNWFKKFVDDHLDHKFIVDVHDPLFATLLPHFSGLHGLEDLGYFKIPNLNTIENLSQELKELYEGFVIVDFVPTSENLCRWLLDIVQDKMKALGIKVSCVEFYETPKSKSAFYA